MCTVVEMVCRADFEKSKTILILAGSSCTHIRKGIDKNFLKKTSQLLKWNTCQDCGDESGAEQAMVEDEEDQESAGAPMIWVCLRCGHRVSPLALCERHAALRL